MKILVIGDIVVSCDPVSYTHLDVYKRQGTCDRLYECIPDDVI